MNSKRLLGALVFSVVSIFASLSLAADSAATTKVQKNVVRLPAGISEKELKTRLQGAMTGVKDLETIQDKINSEVSGASSSGEITKAHLECYKKGAGAAVYESRTQGLKECCEAYKAISSAKTVCDRVAHDLSN